MSLTAPTKRCIARSVRGKDGVEQTPSSFPLEASCGPDLTTLADPRFDVLIYAFARVNCVLRRHDPQ